MFQTAALALAAASAALLGPAAAQETTVAPAVGCYPTYSSGSTYQLDAYVSAGKTIEVTTAVDCTFGTADPDCPKSSCACTTTGAGTEEDPEVETCTDCEKDVTEEERITCNYRCADGANGAWCSQAGYAPPGVNTGDPSYGEIAWDELDCPCEGTQDPPTIPAPEEWEEGGCPAEFSESADYGDGDEVSVDTGNGYSLVYRCKNDLPAPGKYCDQAGFEPGTSLYWAQAWDELGSCSGTLGPTSSPSFDPANDAGGCPSAFDAAATYEAGDRVAIDGLVFECKEGEYAASCSQAGYEPLNADHPDAWPMAWEVEGWCSGTIGPTSSPSYVVLEDAGGCPAAWEEGEYEEGDRVSANNLVFECKGWPMGLHCGQAGFAPLVDDATPDAWKDAWTVVGHCSGTLGPTSSPTFDELAPFVGGCPPEYSSTKNDYGAGDRVTLTVSVDPPRRIAYKCKEWPYNGYCNQHGTFGPGEQYSSFAWEVEGACDGSLAPTFAPTPYTGTCLYDRCRMVEQSDPCVWNPNDPNNENCPEADCTDCTTTNEPCTLGETGCLQVNCDCTTDAQTQTTTCTGCTKPVKTCPTCFYIRDEEECVETQVDNWTQQSGDGLYVPGDVVRVGKTRYRCVDGNNVNCNDATSQPEDPSGRWSFYGIWVEDGECPPARRLRGQRKG